MSGTPGSLADLSVDVLADLRRLRDSIDNTQPERMQVRLLASTAESGIRQALEQARALIDLARELQEQGRQRQAD